MVRKYSRGTYLKYLLAHPWHVIVAGAAVFGVGIWSLFVLLYVFVGIEIGICTLVYNLPAFRKYVDESMGHIARGQAQEERVKIWAQIEDKDRREALHLETKIFVLKDQLAVFPSISTLVIEECLEMWGQYIQQAIQRNMLVQRFAGHDLVSLKTQISQLQTMDQLNPSELTKQRLTIANQRIEAIVKLSDALTTYDYQLAALSELIQLKVEQALVPTIMQDQNFRVSIDDLVMPEADEFAQLPEIDLKMMELGRQ
jgi:hypothetical protein